MDKGPSLKAKIFCVVLVLAATVVFIAAGIWQLNIYRELKDRCTSEVTGTVVYEGYGRMDNTDAPENKYVSGKYWRQIDIEPGSGFELSTVYAERGAEKPGDSITIHFDPDDPDNYYLGDKADYYKTVAYVIFVVSGILPLFLIFVMVKSHKYYRAQGNKRIFFDTPYGRFFFMDDRDSEGGGDIGYEGGIEWGFNPEGAKICTVFFETDFSKEAPKEGYYGLIGKKLAGMEAAGYNINTLIQELPQLRPIRPGKCYKRLEKLLADKKGRDRSLRKLAAGYFFNRPELNRDGCSDKEIMDSTELSYIAVRRNGDTEFELYAPDIYAEDIHVTLKADGSKEIRYITHGQEGYEERREVL